MSEIKGFFKSDRNKILILLMIFVIGGIFGFVYEEIFYRIDLGYFVKRGTTFGPWITIYGFGALLITFTTEKLVKHPIAVFCTAAIVCGLLELATGYALYEMFELRLWNYNIEKWNWLNLGGFICLRSVIFFGAAGLILQYIVQPMLMKFSQKCSRPIFTLTALLTSSLFAFDIIISLLYRALQR